MTAIQNCFDITNVLMKMTDSIREENFDQVMSKIDELLDTRQSFISQIQPPFSDEEMLLGKRIAQLSSELDSKLSKIRDQIKTDMNTLNKKKMSVRKYTNPYESLNFDGMFYDKRK